MLVGGQLLIACLKLTNSAVVWDDETVNTTARLVEASSDGAHCSIGQGSIFDRLCVVGQHQKVTFWIGYLCLHDSSIIVG